MRGAQNIGNNLQTYSQYTLIKGPFYVVFLAITAASGLSLQVTTALCHVVAAYLFAYYASKIIKNRYIFYILFIVSLIIQYPLQRVIRDEISGAILLIIFSLIFSLFIENNKRYYLKTVVIGLLCGVFVLIREDGFLTILPVMLIPVIFFIKNNLSKKLIFMILAIEFFIMFSVIQLNKSINYYKYGSYVGVELVDSDYIGALNSIYRVRENLIQEYLEVTDENLNSIYLISPTLNNLREYLDGTGWRGQSCQFESSTCGKLGTGYFMWALRDAMAESGFYKTPSLAKEAYRNISNEINNACENKKIKCANKYFSNLPNYELLKLSELFYRFIKSIKVALIIPKFSLEASRITSAQEKDVAYYLNISNYLFKPENINYYQINGWYWNPKNLIGWFDISLLEGDKVVVINQAARLNSDDIATHFANKLANNQRFQVYLPCHAEICDLKINGINLGALSNLKNNQDYGIDDGILHIDYIYNHTNRYIDPIIDNKKIININIVNYVNDIYNKLSLYIFILGNISFLFLIIISCIRKVLPRSVIFSTGLWVVFYSKIFFISLVTSLWIPQGINHLYLYPAIVFLPLASIVSISIFFQYWHSFIKRNYKNNFLETSK